MLATSVDRAVARETESRCQQTESAEHPFGELTGFLDDLYGTLSRPSLDPSSVPVAMGSLADCLRSVRNSSSADGWRDCVKMCQRHPLKEILHQDPFTHRAFSKPRGYAGDAEMIDYIYGREEQRLRPTTTWIGSHIFDYTTASPASRGVAARRGFVAGLIDRLTEETPAAHVLSVASGHLREAELAAAIKRRTLGRYVALDADRRSLATVTQDYGRYGVETLEMDVRDLIAARRNLARSISSTRWDCTITCHNGWDGDSPRTCSECCGQRDGW